MSDYKENNENELIENGIKEDRDNKIILIGGNDIVSEETEEQQRMPGRWLRLIIIILIFAAGIAFAVMYLFFSKKNYTGYEVIAEQAKPLPEEAKYTADYGKMICFNNEGISIYNIKGEIEWNAALNMTNPKIVANNGHLAVADIGGRNILVINHKSAPTMQVNLQMLQDILMVDISEQGEIAVLMQADDGYDIKLINPYDKNNSLKAEIKTYSKDDGYALSLAMSKDGSKLVTEYVKSENNEIKSTLTFYNFDKIGENSNADRIVGVFPFEDTIFPKIKFSDNNTVCAYGDNKIVCFYAQREPEMLWEKKVAGKIERIAEDERGFALLINESNIVKADSAALASGSEVNDNYIDIDYLDNGISENYNSVLYSFNYDGSRNFAEKVDINTKGMWFDNGELILHSDNNCIIFNNDGSRKFKTKFKDNIMNFVQADNRLKYYTVIGKKLRIIKLSE